jgi:hypothetical protein
MGRSLIDQEFEDFEDSMPEGVEPEETEVSPAADTAVEIEVVDDTPDADKGKWTADKKPTDTDDDDEVAKYSHSVQKRIAKETAAKHAERRAKEERERQLNEAVTIAQKLMQENNQLKGLIESGEKVLVSESQTRLQSQIEQAKYALREAHEAGDITGQIAAQENLAKLVSERERLSTHVVNPIPRMDEKEVFQQFQAKPQRAPTPDEAALVWRENNQWFGQDEMMTAVAMAVHRKLTAEEGITPSDAKTYYGRIDSEIRKRFPEKFNSPARTAQPRRTDSVVAGPSRSAPANTRKVTLTESQVRLARRLGLTPQQYAEQLVAEGGAKEWTYGKS